MQRMVYGAVEMSGKNITMCVSGYLMFVEEHVYVPNNCLLGVYNFSTPFTGLSYAWISILLKSAGCDDCYKDEYQHREIFPFIEHIDYGIYFRMCWKNRFDNVAC